MASLTLLQIKSAIEDQLEAAFPGITVHRTGVLTGFNRPSFYVRLDALTNDGGLYSRTRQISVDIHYFPTDRYQYTIEVLSVQETLESTFGLNISIQDRVITHGQASGDVVDGVLHFTFDFSYLENQLQPDPGDLMQELDYNG